MAEREDITHTHKVEEVKLLSFSQLHQAYLLKGKLEAHGLYCYLTNEYTEQVAPHFSAMGISMDLMIHKKDLKFAIEVLKDGDERKLLELEGWVLCPQCSSTELKQKYTRGKLMHDLAAIVSGMLLMKRRTNYTCKCCGFQFTA